MLFTCEEMNISNRVCCTMFPMIYGYIIRQKNKACIKIASEAIMPPGNAAKVWNCLNNIPITDRIFARGPIIQSKSIPYCFQLSSGLYWFTFYFIVSKLRDFQLNSRL